MFPSRRIEAFQRRFGGVDYINTSGSLTPNAQPFLESAGVPPLPEKGLRPGWAERLQSSQSASGWDTFKEGVRRSIVWLVFKLDGKSLCTTETALAYFCSIGRPHGAADGISRSRSGDWATLIP